MYVVNYRSQIQLQCLDAHSLLLVAKEKNNGQQRAQNNENMASPGSSLDLEWEHEYENVAQNAW